MFSCLFRSDLVFPPRRASGAEPMDLTSSGAAGRRGRLLPVEVLQFYIPARDSGWEDVISNSMGSVAGFFLFQLCGGAILEELSKWEDCI